MLESNHDITQWEEWNNAPLPISADDAWKEMELLLDEDSSDKVPVPIILPSDEEKGKRKPIIIWWWLMLLGIVLVGGILFNLKKETNPSGNLVVPQNNITTTSLPSKIYTGKPVASSAKSQVADTSVQTKKDTKTIKKSEVTTAKKKETVYTESDTSSTSPTKVNIPSSIINQSKRENTTKEIRSIASNLLLSKKDISTNKRSKHTVNKAKNVVIATRKTQQKTVDASIVANTLRTTKTYSTSKGSASSIRPISNTSKHINRRSGDDKSVKNNISNKQNIDHAAIDSNTFSTSIVSNNNLVNNDSNATIKPHRSTTDSGKVTQAKDTVQEKKDKKKITISGLSAGLQWNASLPFTDNNSNTAKQLIPGLWLSKSIGSKSVLTLSVNPFVMQTNSRFEIENKVQTVGSLGTAIKLDSSWFSFDTASTQFKLDTTIQVNRVATLLQSFGYRIAVDYRYRFAKKWAVLIGVEYNKIISAYINDKIIRVRDGFVAKDASADNKSGSELWALMQHNFLSGSTAISYSPFNKLSISLGFHKPFSSIANGTNQSISPSSYFLNLRWKFWETKE